MGATLEGARAACRSGDRGAEDCRPAKSASALRLRGRLGGCTVHLLGTCVATLSVVPIKSNHRGTNSTHSRTSASSRPMLAWSAGGSSGPEAMAAWVPASERCLSPTRSPLIGRNGARSSRMRGGESTMPDRGTRVGRRAVRLSLLRCQIPS